MRMQNRKQDKAPRSGRAERGTPTIPLTLGGMRGAPRGSSRSFFLLPLALALLAFVALPAIASAGEIPQYEVEQQEEFSVPNTTTTSKPKSKPKSTESKPKSTQPKAHASENSESVEGPVEEPEESSEGEKHKTGGAAPGNGGGNKPNGGGNEGAKQQKNGGEGKNHVGGSKKVANENSVAPVAHKTETSSGGGSSPIVPILIAVIVLAAISIGVVLYRQRKPGGKGPDRRVSSPPAS
jgi:hypothetical protein